MLDVCKVDAKVPKSDEEIGRNIWEMSVNQHKLTKEDYTNCNGLYMLQQGKHLFAI